VEKYTAMTVLINEEIGKITYLISTIIAETGAFRRMHLVAKAFSCGFQSGFRHVI